MPNDLPSIESLNQQFGSESVKFRVGEGGLIQCRVQNQFASVEFYLQGAHVTHYQPLDAAPVLWMSNVSKYAPGQAIRGGIPICWPWFGAHDENPDWPQHGFARTQCWKVRAVLETDSSTEVLLGLTESPSTLELLNQSFDARYRISVGKQLTVELAVTNTGQAPLEKIGCALHSYFSISQIETLKLDGLDGKSYLDKLDQKVKTQAGPVIVDQEIDRIYRETSSPITISDQGAGRQLRVSGTGSHSTVVWNPWVNKSKRMADFPDHGYQNMICVETANAGADVRTIPPSETHAIAQTIELV